MRYPGEVYAPSPRPYHGLEELQYPLHDRTITVTQCRRVCFAHQKINLSTASTVQNVGVRQIADQVRGL